MIRDAALAQRDLPAIDCGTARVELAGKAIILDARGFALAPECATMIVADLHLEKAASLAARGALLPPHDTLDTLRRLARHIADLAPRRLVLLGDSFHSRVHTLREGAAALDVIHELSARTRLIWIAGNHDPELPLALPGEKAKEIMIGDIVLRHLPRADGRAEIVGHLHPTARLATRAGMQRRRCFLVASRRMILPAFGALTGGCDAADPEIAGLFPERRGHAFLMCRNRLEKVPLAAVL